MWMLWPFHLGQFTVYIAYPKLDLERLTAIRRQIDLPLVMHGGSGLSDEDFRNVIKCGINKINYFTAVSFAAVEEIKLALAEKNREDFFTRNWWQEHCKKLKKR